MVEYRYVVNNSFAEVQDVNQLCSKMPHAVWVL